MEGEKYQGFIRGKTLELRPMNKDHINVFNKWANDRRTRRFMRIEMPVAFGEMEEWLQNDENTENVHFEVWHVKDNKIIGDGGLHIINWRNRTAWLGLRIGEIDYWDKGAGSEASELIVKYGFEELNMHKISAGILEPNIGSAKCALKMGMKLETTGKEEVFVDGKYIDINFYSMFEIDWFKFHPVEDN